MNNKTPKPYHIGTYVRNVGHDDVEAGPVLTCYEERDDGECYLVVMWRPNGAPVWGDITNRLVHADDGSPLGEWVPLRDDTDYVWPVGDLFDELGPVGIAMIPLGEANAIIRGEVQQ